MCLLNDFLHSSLGRRVYWGHHLENGCHFWRSKINEMEDGERERSNFLENNGFLSQWCKLGSCYKTVWWSIWPHTGNKKFTCLCVLSKKVGRKQLHLFSLATVKNTPALGALKIHTILDLFCNSFQNWPKESATATPHFHNKNAAALKIDFFFEGDCMTRQRWNEISRKYLDSSFHNFSS